MPRTQVMLAPGKEDCTGLVPTLDEMIDKKFAEDRELRSAVMDFVVHKALEVGTQDGFRKGELLGMRQVLLESMTCRFGPIPLKVRRQLEQISSQKKLLALARRVVTAKTLAGLRL